MSLQSVTMNDIGQFSDFAGKITIKADNSVLACGKHCVVVWATDNTGKLQTTSLKA